MTKEEKAEYMKRWAAANKERLKEYHRQYHENNKDRKCAAARSWYKDNKDRFDEYMKEYRRSGRAQAACRKWKYGITQQQFEDQVRAQRGVCALCRLPPKARGLVVDHCHVTGKLRGLLCDGCNLKLGMLESHCWVNQALDYLDVHK